MTWGSGYGTPWGGGPLTPVAQPVSLVGGDPTSFVFTDEPSGPLPGHWEFFNVQTAGGVPSTEPEPTPEDFFSIQDGFALWRYTRNPLVGDPFDERGYLASPANVVSGRNVRASVIARTPVDFLDISQDSLVYEVAVVVRGNDDLTDYIGARMSAARSAGVWTTPIALEVIRAVPGAAPAVLEAATFDPDPDPADLWGAAPGGLIELEVEVRDGLITASLGGVVQVSATAPDGGSKVGVFVKAYQEAGGFRTVAPVLAGVSALTLRDLAKLGPPPQVEGGRHIEAPQIERIYEMPLTEWLEAGWLKRVGARQFEALIDFDAEVLDSRFGIRVGDLIRCAEPYVGQALTKAVIDLHAERGRGSL